MAETVHARCPSLVLVAMLLVGVASSEFAYHALTTTGSVFLLGHPNTCYTYFPTNSSTPLYLKIRRHGVEALETTFYTSADCDTETPGPEMTFVPRKDVAFAGGISRYVVDETVLGAYFTAGSCSRFGVQSWVRVTKDGKTVRAHVSHDHCATDAYTVGLACSDMKRRVPEWGGFFVGLCDGAAAQSAAALLLLLLLWV